MEYHKKNIGNNYLEFLKIKLSGVQITLLAECLMIVLVGYYLIKKFQKKYHLLNMKWLGLH